MNPLDDLQSDSSEQIDRLVDGELPPAEYRQLLAELDQRPCGWKQCAMGFLEAQAWRREFGSMLGGDDRGSQTTVEPVSAKSTSMWPAPLAVAASFLMALGLGLMLGRQWTGPDAIAPGPNDVVEQTPDDVAPRPVDVPGPVDPPALAEDTRNQTTPEAPFGASPVGDVTLIVRDAAGQTPREIQLPVYEADSTDGPWLGANASAVPIELRRALERSGHRVRRQQRWVPVDLDDGRQMVVPIEDVEIVPVGRHGFQ